jgi:competence protein ComEC
VRLHWRFAAGFARAEAWLEAEREQLALWLVVALGGGIALWLSLPGPRAWAASMLLSAGVALAGAMFVPWRAGRALGLAIHLDAKPRVDSVAEQVAGHPWAQTAPAFAGGRRRSATGQAQRRGG